MATYYITGVWKDNSGVITHVYLHPTNSQGNLLGGSKTLVSSVVRLIVVNNIFTLRWNYQTTSWVTGAAVRTILERSTGRLFLRTVADAQLSDNLDNMINMHAFL